MCFYRIFGIIVCVIGVLNFIVLVGFVRLISQVGFYFGFRFILYFCVGGCFVIFLIFEVCFVYFLIEWMGMIRIEGVIERIWKNKKSKVVEEVRVIFQRVWNDMLMRLDMVLRIKLGNDVVRVVFRKDY